MNLQDLLVKLEACSDARDWVGDKSIEQAVNECERGDWLGWIASKLNIPNQVLCLAAGYAASTADLYRQYLGEAIINEVNKRLC